MHDMYKSLANRLAVLLMLPVFFLVLQLVPLFTCAQFIEYNRTVRGLNYYLMYMDHLLSYHEQTTRMVRDISTAYEKNGGATVTQASWAGYKTVDMPMYRMRMEKIRKAMQNKYDVGDFIQYNKKNNVLPDSVNNLFANWIKRADTITASQTEIAGNLLAVIDNYGQLPPYVQRDIYRIHLFIKEYHSRLADLQHIRDSVTSTAMQFYDNMRAVKKYPLSVYAKAVDDLLQVDVYLNAYFSYSNLENEEAARMALRKADEYIQAYLKDEYTYRKNNDALPGNHVFPFNEEVHIDLSNSLKEISYQINRYISNPEEKVDSVYFSRWIVKLTNMLNVVSFSHDENVDVRKNKEIPERYHADIKAMLRYDFLMYRYDTYRNSLSNKNTSPMPLSWSRYVYYFKYQLPEKDSIAAPVTQSELKIETPAPVEKETISSNIQTIKVYADSLSLFFYDNGEVDNDSITISVNGIVVAQGVRLDSEPYELKLGFAHGEKMKEVTVSANNLGRVPPNTAYLKVTADDIVHRLYLFTTQKINAVIQILNSKEVKIDE